MKIALLAGATILLLTSGCASLDFGSKASSARSEADLSGYFAQRMEMGRQHLAANRPMRAIEAFRQASYDPQHAAAAYNGMGVAYSQMGRHDVARSLFARAIERDPTDQRFARNLVRLENHATGREVDILMAAASTVPDEADPPRSTAPVESATLRAVRSTGGLRATTRREVFITTSVANADRAEALGPPRREIDTISSAPTVSIANRRTQYPVRVALATSPRLAEPRAVAESKSSYPLRVALKSATPVKIVN